jgi:hypothetical protein
MGPINGWKMERAKKELNRVLESRNPRVLTERASTLRRDVTCSHKIINYEVDYNQQTNSLVIAYLFVDSPLLEQTTQLELLAQLTVFVTINARWKV